MKTRESMTNPRQGVPGLTRRQRKATLRQLLFDRELTAIVALAEADSFVVRTLPQFLFDPDKLICWRAIEALGRVAAVIGKTNLERVRVLIRGQVWQMNDESGNVGWYAAETIGEILYNVPQLIDEFGLLLLAYLHEEPFERGAHWAVARVTSLRPDVYRDRLEELLPSLASNDAFIRAFTLLAITHIDKERTAPYAARFADDKEVVSFYDLEEGVLGEASVGEFVMSA